MQQIVARLEAIKKLFAGVQGTESFQHHAVSQANRIKCMVKTMNLTDDEAAELASKVSSVGFPSDVEVDLINKICDRAVSAAGDDESILQDYTNMFGFFKCSTWDRALGENMSEFAVLHCFLADLVAIGLRNLSCPTARILTMLVKRAIATDEAALFGQDEEGNYNSIRSVKKIAKPILEKAPPAEVFVKLLPSDPVEFITQYPSLGVHFQDELPGECPYDVDLIHAVVSSWPCRRPRGGFKGASGKPG